MVKIELTEKGAKGEIIETAGAGAGAPKVRVGVIKLPSFYGGSGAGGAGAAADVHKILDDFKKKGIDAVVIDLRNNGGGLVRGFIRFAGRRRRDNDNKVCFHVGGLQGTNGSRRTQDGGGSTALKLCVVQ